jgi:hypothetical protein
MFRVAYAGRWWRAPEWRRCWADVSRGREIVCGQDWREQAKSACTLVLEPLQLGGLLKSTWRFVVATSLRLLISQLTPLS